MVPVRVLIVDDHRLFAEAVRAILSVERGIEVAGTAASGEDAVRKSAALKPDVVLMDISMPGAGGFEATRRIVAGQPETRVVILTGSDARQDVEAARSAGAVGYVTKDRIAAELIDAVIDAGYARALP
jgi:DNA-binding NarL/FixJ family response regulator